MRDGVLLLQSGVKGWTTLNPDLAFVRWLRVFLLAACGRRSAVDPARTEFPSDSAQRRMIHRLALTYARLSKGTAWPLGAGLAPAPARGPTDSLAAPIAPQMGLGSYRPRVVLVGDAPSQGAAWADRHGWPFISGLRSGCSAWLCDELDKAGVPEEWVFWVNGWRWGSSKQLNTEALQRAVYGGEGRKEPELVVAMGAYARKALDAIGYKAYEEVHHPQHWKRFHSKQPYRLTKLLKRKLA